MTFADAATNSNGTTLDINPKVRRLLDTLVQRWRAFESRGLQARHEVGRLLNEHLGPPTKRQSHGRRVLKMAAEKMQVSESELSRMRWLGHLFPDFGKLTETHPEIVDWTAFKTVLPKMKPSKGNGVENRDTARGLPFYHGLKKSMTALRAKIRKASESEPTDFPEELRTELWHLVKEAKAFLSKTVVSTQATEDEKSFAAVLA